MKKTIKHNLYIIIVLLVSSFIAANMFFFQSKRKTENYQTYFAILPHFVIQPSSIDKAYQSIQQAYNLSGKQLQILIISPDHFEKNTNNLYENIVDKKMCFQSTCIDIHSIYKTKDEDIPERYIKEHGRWAHFSFIQKYFPQAKISLAKLAPRNFGHIATLEKRFRSFKKNINLLVIASVDFSHYTQENRAKLHDLKSYYTLLQARSPQEYKEIEVDCPSCLYLINTRAKIEQKYPELIKRDSSSSIEKTDLWTGNTSRQFFLYTDQKAEDNWVILGFFWDLIFDRRVKTKLNSIKEIQKHFADRYQQWDVSKSPTNYIHRKWFWLDILWYNMETPYVDSTCSLHTNGISFCSSGELFWMLRWLGFNTVTIANNHVRDAGYQGYIQTIDNLKKDNINYAGWTHFWSINTNHIYTKNVRWINIALHAYNTYNRFSGDLEWYCKDLTGYRKQWYRNIVSIHRWTEYETTHNALQERIGKKLIDCGADMIIGHHPHVIQDIQRYKWVPIIYSLWNFLFDQYFSQETKKGMYILAHIPLSWSIEIYTGEVKTTP